MTQQIGDEAVFEIHIMAAAYIGSIPEYDPDTHKWDIYMERVNTFFEANDIGEEAKKRADQAKIVKEKNFSNALLAHIRKNMKPKAEKTDAKD